MTNINADEYANARQGIYFEGFPKSLTGQCFEAGHLVAMSDGTLKSIENIKVGDVVLSIDGKTKNNVIRTQVRHSNIMEMKTSSSKLHVTGEHPFYTQKGWVEANNLSTKDVILIPSIYSSQKSNMTDDELKFLGFWIGDGDTGLRHGTTTSKRYFKATVSSTKKDYVNSLNISFGVSKHSTHKTALRYNLHTKKHLTLTKYLYKCFDEYKEKQIPLIFNKREYGLILDGYLHADGEKLDNGNYNYSTSSKKLAYSLLSVASALGYSMSISERDRNDNDISINGVKVKTIKKQYRGVIITNPTKYDRCGVNVNNRHYSKFRYINDAYKGDVYNLEVDNDNTYICNGHAVHNCVSLVKWFIGEMCGVSDWQAARGHAKDFGDTLVRQGLARVVQSPIRGDLAVYKGGEFGHIGVVLSGNRLFEENANLVGTPSTIIDGQRVYASRISPLYASWRGQATFYRLNGYIEVNNNQGDNMVTTKEQLDSLYLAVLHRQRGSGEGEDVYLGKDSGFVFNDLYRSSERSIRLEQENNNILNLTKSNTELSNKIKEQSDNITSLTTENNKLVETNRTLQAKAEYFAEENNRLDDLSIGELFTKLINKIFKRK